ncbi:hypothetical protein DSCO28_62900 [Desulfosarcina ovata subsp. sediminis]|uniref:Uncharacterized protein n=1 Tax=Desulfosarcina ovata subsp. sediminis TaxID=885957 RepID=A0A5K8A003_9BACT|nr:hypothetical protein [Desulfosarcina ovata]BBO85724.1 hypothetical protein DSCO28_62900 [Desulfosarcina ovata subsp. sediminis]
MTHFRPLGIAKEIVNETGLDVTYAYDDLVFVEHSPFLIKFDDDKPNNLKLFFNVDCETDAAQKLEIQLRQAAEERKFTIEPCGRFELVPKPDTEELDIRFIPA